MGKRRPSAAEDVIEEHPLALQLVRVADEIQLLRQVLDELRTDFQWAIQNGRLQIGAGDCTEELTPVVIGLFDEGDAVEVPHKGQTCFGEISSIDDATNSATVLLIPSNETITVSQDSLRRVEPDALRRHTSADDTMLQPKSPSEAAAPKPATGKLF